MTVARAIANGGSVAPAWVALGRRIAGWVVAAALVAGCGGGGDARGDGTPELVVSAATSLKPALTVYAARYEPAELRLGFGGSDELAAQIRAGVRPDVFAAANTTLPGQLHREGLVEEPVRFARNRLVLAVPSNGKIGSLGDLGRPGVKIAMGAKGVPVGAYARAVLGRLPAAQRNAILANVRSEEPDAGGVVGKLRQGAVDAGFVYATDVRAAGGPLRAIELPERLRPQVFYAAAVVKGTSEPAAARALVADLAEGAGQDALRAAGFEPPR